MRTMWPEEKRLDREALGKAADLGSALFQMAMVYTADPDRFVKRAAPVTEEQVTGFAQIVEGMMLAMGPDTYDKALAAVKRDLEAGGDGMAAAKAAIESAARGR